jgi:hypothetical protein
MAFKPDTPAVQTALLMVKGMAFDVSTAMGPQAMFQGYAMRVMQNPPRRTSAANEPVTH